MTNPRVRLRPLIVMLAAFLMLLALSLRPTGDRSVAATCPPQFLFNIPVGLPLPSTQE